MGRYIFILLLLSLPVTSFSRQSARRPLDRDFREYQAQYQEQYGASKTSALGAARYYTGQNLNTATPWTTNELRLGFETIRDDRFLIWSVHPHFLRRVPWLYPIDGCFARAAVANQRLIKKGFSAAKKIFAFGNLSMRTQYASRGSVGWWYHVAPIVQVSGVRYVIDPAVNGGGPLTVFEWLDRIGTPSKIKVAICGAGAYVPKSSCGNTYVGTTGSVDVKWYLREEWKNLEKLGKDPEDYLGDVFPQGQ